MRLTPLFTTLALALTTGFAATSPHTPPDQIDTSAFAAKGRVRKGLQFERRVDASPAQVFNAWTTEDGVRAFLDIDSKIELEIGGAYELYLQDENPIGERGSEECQILSYVPGRMLSFTWNAPPSFPIARQARTWIVLTFEPAEDGKTLVRVDHLGFGDGGGWPQVKQYFRRAWASTLDRLAEHFAG